jgi:hypothetical protein
MLALAERLGHRDGHRGAAPLQEIASVDRRHARTEEKVEVVGQNRGWLVFDYLTNLSPHFWLKVPKRAWGVLP